MTQVLQLEDAIMKRVDGDLGAVAPAGAAFVLLSPKPSGNAQRHSGGVWEP
jgi:hypothetical protein